MPDHIELLGLGIVRKAYVLRDSGMVIEDHTRAIGPAYSDPRYEGGPCRGRHQRFIVGENRFGRLYACEKCDLTLKYVPWMTSEEVEESTDPVPVPSTAPVPGPSTAPVPEKTKPSKTARRKKDKDTTAGVMAVPRRLIHKARRRAMQRPKKQRSNTTEESTHGESSESDSEFEKNYKKYTMPNDPYLKEEGEEAEQVVRPELKHRVLGDMTTEIERQLESRQGTAHELAKTYERVERDRSTRAISHSFSRMSTKISSSEAPGPVPKEAPESRKKSTRAHRAMLVGSAISCCRARIRFSPELRRGLKSE